jgi:hypothetical protein
MEKRESESERGNGEHERWSESEGGVTRLEEENVRTMMREI